METLSSINSTRNKIHAIHSNIKIKTMHSNRISSKKENSAKCLGNKI